MRFLVGLYLELRVVPVLLWSVTAITIGTALAYRDAGAITVAGYLTALAIGVLLQGLVAHAVNEITDWRSGTDRDPSPRVISGGSKVIASGLMTERELAVVGGVAAVAAIALGIVAASVWSWGLLAFGALGLAGALLYSLPPVRASYRPIFGEVVAFACVWSCVAGAYVLQTNTLSPDAALAGVAHASFCVAMLMMHHYLDRGPDSRATPPKTTTIVRLGRNGRRYAVAWAIIATVAATVLAVAVDTAFVFMAAAYALALVPHLIVDDRSAVSVTRAELSVILLGIVGGLGAASLVAAPLAWALLVAAILVPIELWASSAAHGPLMDERRRLSSEPPGV